MSSQVTYTKLTCRFVEQQGTTAQFLLGVPCSRTYICLLKFSVLASLCWSHALVSREHLSAEPVPDETDQAFSCL